MKLTEYSFREGDLFLFCGYRDHDYKLFKLLTITYNMILIDSPEFLTKELIDKLKPKMIFFPNWSWKVPKEIVDNYPCVCFHEGDLPKGRGGSPIQNHIIRGFKETKSTAYIMNEKIDAGDILCKRDLDLTGSLEEIFDRIIDNNYSMTLEIIEENPVPVPQDDSKAVYYERRKPKDSQIIKYDIKIEELYDFIRMLADPYPNAFFPFFDMKITFKDAQLKNDKIIGRYEIESWDNNTS